MSPVSDTANLAAISSGVNLHSHIRSMAYTTGPTFLIVLVILAIISQNYADNLLPVENLNTLTQALNDSYAI